MKRWILLAALPATLLAAPPLAAEAPAGITEQVRAILAQAGPGTRWGMVVADADGREVIALDPEGRYIPASNTKMFTTAAVFWKFSALDQPDSPSGANVRLVTFGGDKAPTVILTGNGDARLSSAADCMTDCLAPLVDAVAGATKRVKVVIGDGTAFADDRWSPGMSWNNIPTRSGTGVSALTLDNNEAQFTVTASADGQRPVISGPRYYLFENEAMTVAASATNLTWMRMPGSVKVKITGIIALRAAPQNMTMGIDNPPEFAAWRFAEMLKTRGVTVSDKAEFLASPLARRDLYPPPFATALPGPLAEDLVLTNKQSQNLHAELLLRRLGAPEAGTGSIESGLKVVSAMLTTAGLKPNQFAFSDGSGMSTYNRIAPRGAVAFLRWTQAQPWGARFRATLPIGGVDGTLMNRFKGTQLEGKVFAKTGSLNASNALAGFLTARSGRTLTFALYANDVPDDVAATKFMDQALVAVAEAN